MTRMENAIYNYYKKKKVNTCLIVCYNRTNVLREVTMKNIKESIKHELNYIESKEFLIFIESMLKTHNKLNKKSS
mgnify:CR=1 FL=1